MSLHTTRSCLWLKRRPADEGRGQRADSKRRCLQWSADSAPEGVSVGLLIMIPEKEGLT